MKENSSQKLHFVATSETAKNLINYIKILKKIKSTPEKIKRC